VERHDLALVEGPGGLPEVFVLGGEEVGHAGSLSAGSGRVTK
jgi:hypothetical protein